MPTKRNETLKRAGNGVWYVFWSEHNGKRWLQKRRSLGTADEREAHVLLARLHAETARPVEALTVDALIDRYLDSLDSRSDYRKLREMEFRKIRERLGAYRPDDLTAELAEEYAADRLDGAHGWKPVATGTVDKEIRLLRAVLRFAIDRRHWLPQSTPIKLPSPGGGGGRPEWMTKAEACQLIEGCADLHIRTFIIIALHTAQRQSAILRLTWGNVDFDHGIVYFRPARAGSNKRAATVRMNSELRDELLAAKARATCEHVIEYHGRGIRSVRQGFENARERAGLRRSITIHTTKHSCISWMVQAGVPFSKVASFANTSEAVIRKHYAHLSPSYFDECGDATALTVTKNGDSVVPMKRKKG